MNYKTLVSQLIQAIPEIEPAYNDELTWWDDEQPGVHAIFGNVLNPLLIEKLTLREDKQLLERIFDFFELMASSRDEKVTEVLLCTVLERLGDDDLILKQAEPFMKDTTKKLCHDLEKELGR